MVRGDNIVCGTTTTGTGTLTLAASPAPPGGIDFDVFARATGIGFANSAAVLVSYTIIEYTDSTFATAKATEKGMGTLTLGGSSGITNCTLARTKLQTSATSLNSQPAAQNIAPGTGISIGTAANTLVFVGPSSAELFAYSPFVQTTVGGGSSVGAFIATAGAGSGGAMAAFTSGLDYYYTIQWQVPMLVKRCSVQITTGYSGGTPVSNADGRLYDIGSDGRPGKLLYDFGLLGSAGTSFNNSAALVSSGAAGSGYFMMPGEYFFNIAIVFSGGTTPPAIQTPGGVAHGLTTGRSGVTNNGQPIVNFTATGSAIGAAPDPANVAGWAIASWFGQNPALMFAAS